MSYFKAKMHLIRFRLRPPLTELTALPHSPSWILSGPTFKARRGGEKGGRKGVREGEMKGKGVDIAWPDL